MVLLLTISVGAQAAAVITGSFLSGASKSYGAKKRPIANTAYGFVMGLSLVAVPVFLDTDVHASHLLAHFTRLYHYGHRLMPSLAIATFSLYAISVSQRYADKNWLAPLTAGIATLSLVPFTWIAMTPTNYALFELYERDEAEGEPKFSEVRRLVVKWSLLHVVRSLFPLVGAVLGGLDLLR